MSRFSIPRWSTFVVLLVSIMAIGCLTLAVDPTPIPDEYPDMICDRLNESYDPCGSGCGDLTCQNVRKNNIQCGRQCKEGCFCNRGYVRSRSGSCVPSYTCATFG
ncbi:venom peptide SjAPI-2-like [Anopheles merus]|uniref:venom peptide SjAPI-2-like n=1 Tax=Anopheles merus TaxID=30066 RepID=UPI001BE4B234|nr:venom peptide SjAPI-2-like [Anopheles merus]